MLLKITRKLFLKLVVGTCLLFKFELKWKSDWIGTLCLGKVVALAQDRMWHMGILMSQWISDSLMIISCDCLLETLVVWYPKCLFTFWLVELSHCSNDYLPSNFQRVPNFQQSLLSWCPLTFFFAVWKYCASKCCSVTLLGSGIDFLYGPLIPVPRGLQDWGFRPWKYRGRCSH